MSAAFSRCSQSSDLTAPPGRSNWRERTYDGSSSLRQGRRGDVSQQCDGDLVRDAPAIEATRQLLFQGGAYAWNFRPDHTENHCSDSRPVADTAQLGTLDRSIQRHGYKVIAATWPGTEAGIEDLRRNPDKVADLGVTEIVDHYDQIVRKMDRPPIIMG